MRKLLTLLLCLVSSPAWATFTLNGTPTETTAFLNTGGNVITLSHTIPAGNVVMGFMSHSTGTFLASCTAASSTCVVASGANSCDVSGTSPVGALSCFYIISAGASLTSITFVPTVTGDSSGIYIADWSMTAGSTASIAGACTSALGSSTTLTPCATTLAGGNYALIAGINCQQTCSTGTGTGWSNSANLNGNGTISKTNASVNTAPSFPSSPAGTAVSAMIAMLETPASTGRLRGSVVNN